MLPVVVLLPVADLLVDLLVVVLGVLPVVLVVWAPVGLLVDLLVPPKVLAVSGVAVVALVVVVEWVGLLPTCFHCWVRVSQRVP